MWKHNRHHITKAVLRYKNGTRKAGSAEVRGRQTILQGYNNQHDILLAQKQKFRSKEQNRKPRYKPKHL